MSASIKYCIIQNILKKDNSVKSLFSFFNLSFIVNL